MNERRIITLGQLECAVKYSSTSNLESLFFNKLPNAEPIIEAAEAYSTESVRALDKLDQLKKVLAEVKEFKL